MSDNIRPNIRALIERGKITLEEYKQLRCNSWEFEAMVPALSLDALLWASENCVRNCSKVSRPATTYDEAMHSVYAPELIRRLRLFQEERRIEPKRIGRREEETGVEGHGMRETGYACNGCGTFSGNESDPCPTCDDAELPDYGGGISGG